MIGLAFLAVITLWGFVCYKLAVFVFRVNENATIKRVCVSFLTAFFLLLPIADEIVGGFQFRALCKAEASAAIYDEEIIGKVLVSVGAADYELSGYVLPITKLVFSYQDFDNKDIVISWNYFKAKGGFVSRSLNFLGSDAPYTFNGICAPEVSGSKLFKKLNVEVQYK